MVKIVNRGVRYNFHVDKCDAAVIGQTSGPRRRTSGARSNGPQKIAFRRFLVYEDEKTVYIDQPSPFVIIETSFLVKA